MHAILMPAAACLALTAPCLAPPATPIDELVIYALDADTSDLLRYTFENDGQPDDFTVVGQVIDQNGYVLDHPEGFTYLPGGAYKGFYASPMGKDGTGGPEHVLASISGFDASAFCYPSSFTYEGVRGMTARSLGGGNWQLLAIAHNNWNAKLVEIDPADGTQSVVMDLPREWLTRSDGVTACDAGSQQQGCEWEGVSRHYDADKLFGVTGWALYEIDLSAGTVSHLFNHVGYDRTESLEIAFGDGTNRIDIPGVPQSWTNNGALFAFSDNLNKLLVYDIGGGPVQVAEYDCSFVTVDCEGLIFLTQAQDPFGEIVVTPHD